MTDNTNKSVEGISELQRKQVADLLMELLKSCYPAQHEYLLVRAEQYESMCYTRASNIPHYYQLVDEGVTKIRDAYKKGQLGTAGNRASASSPEQQADAGMRNTLTSIETAAQGVNSRAVRNQPAKTTTDHLPNPINPTNSINYSNPPNSAASAIPVNSINSLPNRTNPPGPVINPVMQQVNHIPATMESYMVNPTATVTPVPTPANAQLTQFGNSAINNMIFTSAPLVTNPSIHGMPNTVGNHVFNGTVNPSVNRIPSHMLPNPSANPAVNPSVNPPFNPSFNPPTNNMINQMNGQVPNQMFNQMANPYQSTSRNPAPMVARMDMVAVNPNVNRPYNGTLTNSHFQTTVHHPQIVQPQSEGVNQFLLSSGIIPASMLSDVPKTTANMQGMPIGNPNQAIPIPAPSHASKQMIGSQNTVLGNPNISRMSQFSVSVPESVSHKPGAGTQAPPIITSSRGRQTSSTASSGSKGERSSAKTFQRSRSKKRNSSVAGINPQTHSPAPAQRAHRHTVSKRVFNPTPAVAAASSHRQAPVHVTAHLQNQIGGPSAHSPNLTEQLPLSHPSMNERIFISDSIHVSLRQVCVAAASCGYKLTVEKIKSLSKEQLLRLFIRSRQMALNRASNLPRGESGQIHVSKKHLEALGVECEMVECSGEQTGVVTSIQNGVPNSTLQIARRVSVPANMRMNRTGMIPHTSSSQSVVHRTSGSSQDTRLNQGSGIAQSYSANNNAQELSNHQDPSQGGGPRVTARGTDSCRGPANSVSPWTGNMPAFQSKNSPSQAHVIPGSGARANLGQRPESLHNKSKETSPTTTENAGNQIRTSGAQSTQQRSADIRTFRNNGATLSNRVTRFQQKYAVYKSLINQTLGMLLSMGHEGQNQVLYLRYSLQLLTRPTDMGAKLTLDVLNTTENFLRNFLVRYQGIPMKSELGQSKQTSASKAGRSAVKHATNPNKESNAQIHVTNQAQIGTNNAPIGQDKETAQANKSEAGGPLISEAQVQHANAMVKEQDSGMRQKGTSVTSSPQTPVTSKPVSHGRVQNMNQTDTAVQAQNMHSALAQKANRVNHYVRMALHAVEKCEKNLEEESMLHLKEERISEVCYVFQDDNMKRASEAKGIANAEEEPETSLLEIVKAECESVYEKHKKLMVNIGEKWKKPVVECLLAYQSIRLPKIIIHVGGTYRKDLSSSFSFERPPLGWVPVLIDIKKRFIAHMEDREGVSGVLEAWAMAAEEVLEDDNVCNQ